MTLRTGVFVAAVVVASMAEAAPAAVRVWEGTFSIPVSVEGPPDRNPAFDQYATSRFNYPYTLRDNLTDRKVDQPLRAVFLENEYLKCWVLPDIGGHLYTCTDKVNNQPLFYANPTIKKANIGYRGAWAAFGIEFNFPVSHNWVSMSPVQYSYRSNPDGSASAFVGNIDRPYGMEWQVELILRPGSTLLEQRVTLENRADVRRRFYWWNNAGIEVKDDSRIQYPMRFSASHGFTDVDTWPVDRTGKDLSIVKNQTDGPVSRFVHGSREPFMGVWRPDTKAGVVHYADYGSLPAKKIWSWGVDPDGLDWRRALSDNNSAYVEVQAGLMRNQETYAFLQPRQSIHFSEYWMPVRETGGVSRANLNGVVAMRREGGDLAVALNVNRAFPGSKIRILDGDQTVLEQPADLSPERTWTAKAPNARSDRRYTFELNDAKGHELLRHTEGGYDWSPASEIKTGPQAGHQPPPKDKRTAEDWVEIGDDLEVNGELLSAMDTYTQALAKNPESFAALKAAGRLAATLARYEEAVAHLEKAAARATQDPEIAYYLAIAYDGLGQSRKARTAFENAARMPEFREAGSLRLAELLARSGNLGSAIDKLGALPGDLRSAEERVALLRAAGHEDEAAKLAEWWLARRQSAFLKYDAGNARNPDPALLRYLAADAYRVIDIAAQYMRLGLYNRALDVLSIQYPDVPAFETEPGVPLPGKNPMIAYYRAYCRAKTGGDGKADYAEAARMPAVYVFPNRPESTDVLQAALAANPADASAHNLLGTLYFSRGMTDAGLAEWSRARELDPKTPVLHASMGRAFLYVKHDPKRAAEAFREGMNVDPSNLALYFGLDQAMTLENQPAAERAAAIERYPDRAAMPAELVYTLALDLAEAGQFDKATSLFRNRFFAREEGGTNVRQVWTEVRASQAVALAKAGKCEDALSVAGSLARPVDGLAFTKDGMEAFVASGRTQFLLGNAYAACGKKDEAAQRWQAAAKAADPAQLVWARAAARQLPGFDEAAWRQKLESAIKRFDAVNEEGSVWAAATAASIAHSLGRKEEAKARFEQAILATDRNMAHHLAREARSL